MSARRRIAAIFYGLFINADPLRAKRIKPSTFAPPAFLLLECASASGQL
jgi:hypothetical protein